MTAQMWGGRFEQKASELLRRLNDSFAFDAELFAEDVQGSMAWAGALAKAGILTGPESMAIREALAGIPAPGQERRAHEDVHSYVEAKLREAVGDLAGKLHTGRSRNDQVATDLKLWLKQACAEADQLITALGSALAERALSEAATAMPGYTHGKRAEPVTFGHWCLAYTEMLLRDRSRFREAVERGDECPLGSGALAGTPLRIDRQALAESLGFARPTRNSLDAVSDRDFAADYLYAASLLQSHLSRMAEDLIFFTNDETGFAELPDSMATGSSRMPQKKNPDVLELTRGHAARAIGELTGFLGLFKGLPLAYNKDLQLDKEPLFRTRTVLALILPALTEILSALTLHRERMREAATDDLLLATELADAIAARGVPFRKAHQIASARVGEALRTKRSLRDLGPTTEITEIDLAALDVEKALSKRGSLGGTSPAQVERQARAALAQLAER